jgi:hypothetical protein
MSVIVLLADGVRPDTLAGAIASGALPALAELRERGGLFPVTSAFPSVTGPAYAPVLMGRFPGSVGLPGIRWFDRSRQTCSFPDYTRSYAGYQMGAVNRDLNRAASTIFEIVPESAAACSLITRGLTRRRQLASLTARTAFRLARTHFSGQPQAWLSVDEEVSTRLVRRVRENHAPFVFAAFTGVDKMSHATGHDSAGVVEALTIVDRTIAAVTEDLTRRRIRDETHIWVTSDHGHSSVRKHEDLARVVAACGHRVLSHPWVFTLRPDVAVMVSGNAMAHLYVDLTRRERPYWPGMPERFRELAEQMLCQPSVDLVLIPQSPTTCAIWSRGRGRATVACKEDRFSYTRADGDPLRVGLDLCDVTPAHAHEATRNTDYPDSVVQVALLASSDRSGDIMLSAARDWDFRARYEPIKHVSSHGALHRDHMMVPLLLDSPPARFPKRTADVMPSALAALGYEIPSGLDGESFI